MRPGDIIRVRDERWAVCHHVVYDDVSVVDVRGCDRRNRGERTRFILPFERHDLLPPIRATRIVTPRRWRHGARHVLATATPSCDSLRALASARIDVHPFQLEPALAVVRGVAARILIADAVGLGKTIQAGLVISEVLTRAADGHALVVCPASLREQWAGELQQRFGLEPVVLDATAIARVAPRALPEVNPWTAHPLVIASVDFVKRVEVLRALERALWDVVVLDEAHGLAGRSDRHAAATLLGERARTLVMLTATPHSGREDAFQRLCQLGDLPPHFPLAVFHRTRHDVGFATSRRTTWLHVAPTEAERQMHGALATYTRLVWHQRHDRADGARLAMLVLLRRATSSAASLARSVERRLRFLADDTEDDQRTQLALPFGVPDGDDEEPSPELAAPGLSDGHAERAMLQELLDLARRAAGGESKVRAIRRYLTRTRESAIIFTEYRDTLAALALQLSDFECIELHGECTAAERQRALQQFVAGERRVLLATDAASEGLNLHRRCRLVIHLEVPWTPLRSEQRVGRVDRIGQRQRVHQVHLVAATTAEESTVVPLVRERAARAREALETIRQPSASEVGDRLFGTDAGTQPDTASEGTPRLLVPRGLREAASGEASRVSMSRLGHSASTDHGFRARPFGATLGRGGTRGLWAFRIAVATSDEELLWEAIVGFEYIATGARGRTARAHAAHLDAARAQLAPHLHAYRARLAAQASSSLEPASTLGLAREDAILAAIGIQQARLAAALLQPALFTRHVERSGTAQKEVLEEAAARCRAQLARLSRRLRPVTLEPEPILAAIRR